jgi:tetratricopeptide (TPR) repeat protein
MRPLARSLVFLVAAAAALPIVIDAQSTPATARSEARIQLGQLLFDDERYWEAIQVFDQAKTGAGPEQVVRASSGLLKSLLQVAEFTKAREEAEFLIARAPRDPAVLGLHGDALWSVGLFDEAEQAYRDLLALDPASGAGRHGLAKSLATRREFDEALDWVQSAIEVSPDVPAFHHALGFIYQRMHRFQDAAAAYERYIGLLPSSANSEKVAWARPTSWRR